MLWGVATMKTPKILPESTFFHNFTFFQSILAWYNRIHPHRRSSTKSTPMFNATLSISHFHDLSWWCQAYCQSVLLIPYLYFRHIVSGGHVSVCLSHTTGITHQVMNGRRLKQPRIGEADMPKRVGGESMEEVWMPSAHAHTQICAYLWPCALWFDKTNQCVCWFWRLW